MTQQRLSRVQLVNWGTFDGSRSFGVPRRGLLLTGPSGAGKSSVLDAMASILVRPAKLKFNAAAQGTETGDRERTLVTYVLGAYKRETDDATGEVGTAFLRKGPTWSGVALTFSDGRGGVTTLMRLFHLRARSTDARDLKSMYIMAPEAVDLMALQPYVKDGIENRRVNQAFPSWDVFSQDAYTGFAAKFRRRLGLGSEQAQLLLHKTQSAKNLTNLDALFREFMLDEPDTFELSQETVAQFADLSLAHAAVVDARRQVETLAPLRDMARAHAEATAELGDLADEAGHLGAWLASRELAEKEASLDKERPRLARLDHELARAESELADAENARVQAQRAIDGSAGAQLASLEALIDALGAQILDRQARVARLAAVATTVGLVWPDNADELPGFAERVGELSAQVADDERAHEQAKYNAMDIRRRAGDRLAAIDDELDLLRRHGSNLDPRLLRIRQLLVDRLQVAESTLPFVGELIQVRPEEGEWTGAIERVLGSFARTLVVPERHYLGAAQVIDAEFLGTRLVYEKATAAAVAPPDDLPGATSLLNKVELADGPHRDWLDDRLRRRFDYACVDRPADFADFDKAVTRAGQVKHSSTLHEKDDRRRVDDRSRWVLGFSTEAKEAELERQRTIAQGEATAANRDLDTLDQRSADLRLRLGALDELSRVEWAGLDVAHLERQRARHVAELDQLRRDNVGLPRLEHELATAHRRVADAEDTRRRLAADRDRVDGLVTGLEQAVGELAAQVSAAPPVPDNVMHALSERAATLAVGGTRLEIALRDDMAQRTSAAQVRRSRTERSILRQVGSYRVGWPAQSADWGDEVDYLPEFLERLGELERDRLPEFERRFFELLQSQARNNISQLAMQIKGARREIRSRVDEVNKSLQLTPFSPGGYLQIEVRGRALPDVDAFLSTLTQITSGSVDDVFASDDEAARVVAERRFTMMKGLLDRLGSSDPADKVWRDRCLDTRQHMQFQARVQDEDGVQLDVFTGSGGRSGGERQKLVTFCLAAALRFQLAPPGQTEPTYALVVIDEAFDKADHTFTQAGLEVFKAFGFQLVLATPMKMLQTIEDYVGGVVMVSNDSGRGSLVQELRFEADDVFDHEDDAVAQDALL